MASIPPLPKPDPSQDLRKWLVFPDALESRRFAGYQSRDDISQIPGAFVIGQNVAMSEGQNPTLRDGTELIGTEAADATPVNRAWTYETRGGVQIELKAYGTRLDYWVNGVSTEWLLLKDGFTSGQVFGYGNIGKTTDTLSYTYFCNGTESWYRYSGAYALYASDNTTDQITVAGATSLSSLGFAAQTAIGDSTTRFDITNPAGTTFRYTFDGTGTDPLISTATFGIGQKVWIGAQNFAAANNGLFTVTGVGANYFEVTNASGTAENDKTIGSGYIYRNAKSFILNGTEVFYQGLSAQTFTGCNTIPGSLTVGMVLTQSPEILVTSTDPIKGSVAMAHDFRLHARQESKANVWNYSKLDDPQNFSTGSSDGDGGSKEVEFGGPITAFGKLNKTALCFKERIIKILDFIQVGSRVDSPRYQTLVSADDKSTTLGAVNQKSTFATPFGIVFITPDKRMALLTGVTANNEPQYLILSDPIEQVFARGVHDEGTGICVDNYIYYAFKSDNTATYNDTVIRGNMLRRTISSRGEALPIQWDTPYVGLNVNDFTSVYNSTTGRNEVHLHSSLNSNTYKFIADKTDNASPYTAIVRTHAEVFGYPQHQKRIDECFIEIKMLENSIVYATLLYDEDGVTESTQYTLSGSETQYLVQASSAYNPFGASPFGSQKIGSNEEQDALKRYIFELEVKPNVRFFNLSLQLAADTENSDFELVRYGYRLKQVLTTTSREQKKGLSS